MYAVDKSGIIHQVAGNGTTTTTVPGQATGTALLAPNSLAVDAAGDIYITDAPANRVYTVFASTTSSGSNIATTLGTGTSGNTGDSGFANLAQVNNPISVTVDGSANLFVVDNGNSSVREINYPSTTLAFDTITVGQSSPVLQQNLSNFGTDNLNLTAAISTSNPQFTVDSSTTTCGTTILAGSTCNLGFVFTPTSSGSASATVVFASNSFNSPQPLNLTGTGQQILPLQFTLPPETEVYGQPFPETVLVSSTNPAPTGTITFSLGKTILCTLTTTLTATTTCNASNSGLSTGTYNVTFSYTGDSNYTSASGTVTLTVTPAPLTVTSDNASREYGAANPTFTGTLTGVLPGDTILVSYSTAAILTSPVGPYPITATLTPGGSTKLSNYTITNNPGTLTVTPAPLTVTTLSASRQYGQPNPSFSSTTTVTLNGVTKPGTLNGDALTITYSTTATITSPVGTYAINATVSGSASGNYAVTFVAGTLNVTAAPLTVTVGNASRPYGTANPTFTSTVSGALNGDTFTNTYSTAATISSSVGSYAINDVVSGPATSNYTITVVPGTLTITTATVTLNVADNNATRLYGALNPTFTSTIIGALNGDTFTITYATTATAASPVGTYTVTPTVSGLAAGNYNITIAGGTLTVTAAPLTVTANNASRAYGIANPTFTGAITGLVNGDTVNATYSTAAVLNSPVGAYAIVPAVTGVSANYTLSTVNGTLNVTQNPSSLVVNVNSAARVYGAANPAFSGTITGVIPGDDVVVTYSTTAAPTSPAGNYAIGANVSGTSAGNYIATIHPGSLAVSAATTITTVTTSGSPATAGATVTFTATVTSAAGVVSGTVNFLDGTTLLGTSTLNASGVADLLHLVAGPGHAHHQRRLPGQQQLPRQLRLGRPTRQRACRNLHHRRLAGNPVHQGRGRDGLPGGRHLCRLLRRTDQSLLLRSSCRRRLHLRQQPNPHGRWHRNGRHDGHHHHSRRQTQQSRHPSLQPGGLRAHHSRRSLPRRTHRSRSLLRRLPPPQKTRYSEDAPAHCHPLLPCYSGPDRMRLPQHYLQELHHRHHRNQRQLFSTRSIHLGRPVRR